MDQPVPLKHVVMAIAEACSDLVAIVIRQEDLANHIVRRIYRKPIAKPEIKLARSEEENLLCNRDSDRYVGQDAVSEQFCAGASPWSKRFKPACWSRACDNRGFFS